MYRLNHIKETLMCCVERQMGNLNNVDTKELGEVIDMIKDLEEAIYYCTVTEAMNNPQKYGWGMEEEKNGHAYSGASYYPMMYYTDGKGHGATNNGNGSSTSGGRQYYSTPWEPWKNPYDHEMNMEEHEKEGRAGKSRRQYMDSKAMKKDKKIQMRDLEKYAQELGADIIEMIDDATPEEKQYLSKKISGLAEKVGKLT